MKVSDYIVLFLRQQGIKHIFGYIGGMITHLVDSIDKIEGIDYIQTYHEQTAAIAAEGYSIETNNFGVAISTSGPGVTNMMTGIADAYFDSIPTLFISGQVNTSEYKYDKPIRQQGFQEMDVVSVCKPITKYAVLVDDAKKIRYELEKAISIAKEDRGGPVILDIPMDIQRIEINPDKLESYFKKEKSFNNCNIDEVIKQIESSRKPIIIIGSGCRKVTKNKLETLLEKYKIPVVCSLLGKGQVNEENKLFLGMIGSYGVRAANIALAKSDLIISIGSRLDTRQTGANLLVFETKKIIQIDIDKNELENHRLKNRICVNCGSENLINKLLKEKIDFNENKNWSDYIVYLKNNYSQEKEIERFVENKMPYKSIQILNKYSKENDIFTVDIGQNQMWAAQTLLLKKGQSFVTSGGLAPMGFSIPSAIGISFADPKRRVFAIVGDGGFMMSEQSLFIVSQYNLPIIIILLNNTSLGMITQFQQLYFNSNMSGTTEKGGYKSGDFNKLSNAHGLDYFLIEEKDLDNKEYIENIFSKINAVVEFKINGLTSVYPKLEFNQPIYNPIPYLPEEELKGLISKIL
jgi:acetolactate synthase-1/2/3 large subunit